MTGLALDIWQDLREKRLWPVAVGILCALIAVPVILFKPASTPAPAPLPHVSGPVSGTQLPVSSVTSTIGNPSNLDKFVQRDPFKPLASLAGASATKPSSTSSTPVSSSTIPSTGSSKAGGSGGSSGGASGGGGGGTPTPSTVHSTTPSQPVITHFYYSWEVNVKFGRFGHEKSYDSLKALGMLPDTENPIVTFMGVEQTSKGEVAVFFVPDPDIVAYGKGGCNNGGGACRFVYLDTSGRSSENFSTLDGSKKYRLDLVGINTYKLNPPKASSSSAGSGATSAAQQDVGLAIQSLASFAGN